MDCITWNDLVNLRGDYDVILFGGCNGVGKSWLADMLCCDVYSFADPIRSYMLERELVYRGFDLRDVGVKRRFVGLREDLIRYGLEFNSLYPGGVLDYAVRSVLVSDGCCCFDDWRFVRERVGLEEYGFRCCGVKVCSDRVGVGRDIGDLSDVDFDFCYNNV